jgi:hypothetical protein
MPTGYVITTPENVAYNYAPVVPSNNGILKIVRITPAPDVLPSMKLYDKEDLKYSLPSEVDIQSPEKNKEIILALDTTAKLGSAGSPETLNEKIFDYTLFSGETDTTLPKDKQLYFESTGIYVKGTMHSNAKISLNPESSPASIFEGNIEAVSSIEATWGTIFDSGTISGSSVPAAGSCTLNNGANYKVRAIFR